MLDDAHCHYQDADLDPHWPQILPLLQNLPLRHAVVNGTQPGDWERVSQWKSRLPGIIPSYGLHPWYIKEAASDWPQLLEERLRQEPDAGIGEFGLDRWVQGHDLPQQIAVFQTHFKFVEKYDRVASIHCVQAWGELLTQLQLGLRTPRPFLIHAYGGPLEMVGAFAKLGAYFSFSPYFLHPRKIAQRVAFTHIPLDRLLIETDAPAMPPPDASNPCLIADSDSQKILNHPANLKISLGGLSDLRNIPKSELSQHLAENFFKLWNLH